MNREHLWLKLIQNNIDEATIKALIAYYNDSWMLVKKDDEVGGFFKTTVGVRQGGVISPKLFSIYVESLIPDIERCEAGVAIGTVNVDVLLYADDVVLVSHTREGLQSMLNVVSEFGTNNDTIFNPSKTIFMIFNKSRMNMNDLVIKLNGTPIVQAKQVKYLGYIITDNGTMTQHIKKRKSITVAMISTLRSQGLLDCTVNIRTKILVFKSFVRATLLYGAENILITDNIINEIRRVEGNFIKAIAGVPNTCRTSELMAAFSVQETRDYMAQMKLGFMKRLVANEYTNSIVKELFELKLVGLFDHEIKALIGLDPNSSLNECMLALEPHKLVPILTFFYIYIDRISLSYNID